VEIIVRSRDGVNACGRSSVVERLLAKEMVVSSNLIARSDMAGHLAGLFAEIAQSVKHSTENAGVPSSSLGLGTCGTCPCLRKASSGGSSNGRTTDFGSVNRGSTPCPPASTGAGHPASVFLSAVTCSVMQRHGVCSSMAEH